MKRFLISGMGLFLFACNPQGKSSVVLSTGSLAQDRGVSIVPQYGEPVSPETTQRTKREILAYLDALIQNEKVIVGQHCGDGVDAIATYYGDYVDVLADITGRHVGLIGADFGFFPSTDFPLQPLIDHWNQGGLVTVSWHADNPFEPGYRVFDVYMGRESQIDLKSLLKDAPQTSAWISYRTELDKVAGALLKLKDAGVTVLWRPFPEMNGDYFWWGINGQYDQQTNARNFRALWIDMYHSLTEDYGLDNLIWTYSVIPDMGWNAQVTALYPGSDYVDLVGVDYYGSQPDFPDYEALKSLGKTLVVTETGPNDESYGQWNMMDLVKTLKGRAAYFLQWHSRPEAALAIKDNKNAMQMMQSGTVITLDELWQKVP